ncbi:MAG: 16S rRNA (uracil(1498)-N(3))-methyltransferase [Syntrophales bacterium]
MTIPRIYLPQPLDTGDTCAVTAEQARYLGSVLRMRAGEPILVFNGTPWEYEAVVRQAAEGMAIEITGRRAMPSDGIEVTLCQAIPKAEKMDGIIRHATELGVGRIIPFLAERSVPRWPAAKWPQKRERWQKIALEAARQSGRIDIPEIGGIASFAEMLDSARSGEMKLIPWEEESGLGIREILRDPRYDGMKSFHLVIGPEGGFGKEEIDRARGAGFLSVSLGRRVLRVETAALAVLAILQYERGGLGGTDTGRPL